MSSAATHAAVTLPKCSCQKWAANSGTSAIDSSRPANGSPQISANSISPAAAWAGRATNARAPRASRRVRGMGGFGRAETAMGFSHGRGDRWNPRNATETGPGVRLDAQFCLRHERAGGPHAVSQGKRRRYRPKDLQTGHYGWAKSRNLRCNLARRSGGPRHRRRICLRSASRQPMVQRSNPRRPAATAIMVFGRCVARDGTGCLERAECAIPNVFELTGPPPPACRSTRPRIGASG